MLLFFLSVQPRRSLVLCLATEFVWASFTPQSFQVSKGQNEPFSAHWRCTRAHSGSVWRGVQIFINKSNQRQCVVPKAKTLVSWWRKYLKLLRISSILFLVALSATLLALLLVLVLNRAPGEEFLTYLNSHLKQALGQGLQGARSVRPGHCSAVDFTQLEIY